jgi:ABC-type Fe3+/spermidine/putrescine transport system ATPase subunit
MLALVGLEQMANRRPKQLSGGQQQRVALARALVFNPPVLLMDEPLGALDRQLRQRMQLEIKHIQQQIGITVIYVTHDQEEALTMSDQIAIMNKGNIEQLGSPIDLYEKPVNTFVAEFMGESNLIPVEVSMLLADGYRAKLESGATILLTASQALKIGQRVLLSLRPERLEVPATENSKNLLEGVIQETVYLGEASRIKIRLDGGKSHIIAKIPNSTSTQSARTMVQGERVSLGWDIQDAVVLVK